MSPSSDEVNDDNLYGLLGEFETADALLEAAKRTREAGYENAEAYAPFTVDGLGEALGFDPSGVPKATFIGALVGGIGTYFLQWYSAVVDYPIVVGGRPLHSWPMFVPATFDMALLGAAIGGVLAFVVGSGLPRLNHPMFDARDFELASRNRFFLCLRSDDAAFERKRSAEFLTSLKPIRRSVVSGR